MQHLGLSASDRRVYERTLRSTHTRRTHVAVLNLDGDVIASLNGTVLDGQVNGDLDSEITRSCTLTIYDPLHSLNFDTDSPDDGALYFDRMIRVTVRVFVEALDTHVEADVFTGPITKLDRDDDVVQIEAQGKEVLAKAPIWRPLKVAKGSKKTDAIRLVLRDRLGETKTEIPDRGARVPRGISLSRLADGWTFVQHLARSMDTQLFYPGTGRATQRDWPRRPLYVFRTGDGGDITSSPRITYSTTEGLKNTVIVIGGKPRGAKQRVRFTAVADPDHPLSPKRLGRTGAPRHLVEVIEDETIRSEKEAEQKARRVLEDRLRSAVDVSFEAMPIWHLDLGDVIGVQTADGAYFEARLRSFSLPLGTEGDPTMSVGFHKRTYPRRKKIRR